MDELNNEIVDENDRHLVSLEWYLPNLITSLKEKGHCYTYYRGKKITSDMTEEQIYAMTYGSKEAFNKKYPNGYSQESLDTSKDELLYTFISATSPDVAKAHLEKIKKEGKCTLDYDLGEYILALAGGAPCKDIYSLLNNTYNSVDSQSWMISHIANWSLRGDEFLKYFKEVNPIGYEIYFSKADKTDDDIERL